MKKVLLTIVMVLLSLVITLTAVFLIGRFGWKLGGFRFCDGANLQQVSVEEGQVRLCGNYPGIFGKGFLGYHAEQNGSTLYVGFKFSGLFGIFENGEFDITIPTEGTVEQIVVKTGRYETSIWPVEDEWTEAE